MLFSLSSLSSARAATLTFDDLPSIPGGGFFGADAPNDYQGLDFSNAGLGGWYWDTDAPPWVSQSAPHSISTAFGPGLGLIDSAVIRSATPFSFGGAFFSGGWTPVYIELTGADGSSHKIGGFDYSFASGASFDLSGGPVSFINPLSSLAITAITIWAPTGSFAVDDIVINALLSSTPGSPVAPIPEPSTYALMGFGLLGVAWMAKRRRCEGAGLAAVRV